MYHCLSQWQAWWEIFIFNNPKASCNAVKTPRAPSSQRPLWIETSTQSLVLQHQRLSFESGFVSSRMTCVSTFVDLMINWYHRSYVMISLLPHSFVSSTGSSTSTLSKYKMHDLGPLQLYLDSRFNNTRSGVCSSISLCFNNFLSSSTWLTASLFLLLAALRLWCDSTPWL